MFLISRNSSTPIFLLLVLSIIIYSLPGDGSAQDIGQIQSELKGDLTTARPEVGKLFIVRNGERYLCTATLLSSRHFITAAHCISNAPIYRGGTLHIEIDGEEKLYPVDLIFGQRHNGSINTRNWDWAVGRLAEPVTANITYPKLATRQPRQGEMLTAIGYGCTERGTQNGLEEKRFREYSYAGSTSFHCGGDSGGPTFLGGLKEGGPIVRVHSGYRYAFPFSEHDIGVNVVAWRKHILALIDAFEHDGICYRVHVQDEGWMPATCDGWMAGTIGQSRRVEAIQIWSSRPEISVCYQPHVQSRGWMEEACDGAMAGTTDRELRLEALVIRLKENPLGEKLRYQAYLQDRGWGDIVGDGVRVGTTGQGRRLEAIRIWLVPAQGD